MLFIGTPTPNLWLHQRATETQREGGSLLGFNGLPWALHLVDLTNVVQNPLQGLGRSREPCGRGHSLPWLSSGSQKHFFSSGKQ